MTYTAIELIRNPELAIDPMTVEITDSGKKGYSPHELDIFKINHEDIHKLVVKIFEEGRTTKVKKGKHKGDIVHAPPTVVKNLRQFITDASFEDNLERTPTFTLVVHDPDWEILNTGIIDEPFDINPGKIKNRFYSLTSCSVNDDEITLTFSTTNAVLLMHEHRPMKANRNSMTRAQFIKGLTQRVQYNKIPFFATELNKKQKKDKITNDPAVKRHNERALGFTPSDKITVKHTPASGHQRKVISTVIEAGHDGNFGSLLIVAGVMTIIQESGAGVNNHTAGTSYWGVFQQDPGDTWPGTAYGTTGVGDVYKDARGDHSIGKKSGGFYGWIKKVWDDANHNIDLGLLIARAQGVEHSTNPLNAGYAQSVNRWRDEAQHAVNAWGIAVDDPGGPAQADTVPFEKKYSFQVPKDGEGHENYLTAIYRLAEDVKWTAFWVRDELHFESQNDLFKQQARKRLRRYQDGVESVSFEWDHIEKIDNMVLNVRMDRWVAPVGTVVVFDEGGPGKGRWLVSSIRRSVFNELGEITLSKPIKERLEPIIVGEKNVEPVTTPGGGGGTTQYPVDGDLLSQVHDGMTAGQVVNQIVLPVAQSFHMTAGIDANAVVAANKLHTHLGSNSWHKGDTGDATVSTYHWAVDMSDGTPGASVNKNKLADFLIKGFRMNGLDSLPSPHAKYPEQHPENLVDDTPGHKGFEFQIIYKCNTDQAGNHYDHVHFGAKKLTLAKPGI